MYHHLKQHTCILRAATVLCLLACGSHSRRDEIEQRKEALRHKQDSTLLATQQELARTDSLLAAVKSQYAAMSATVDRHKAQLKATPQELTALTRLRMRRDSLQVAWETQGAKIRYIRKKQEETGGGK
jgi:hypothetical protein